MAFVYPQFSNPCNKSYTNPKKKGNENKASQDSPTQFGRPIRVSYPYPNNGWPREVRLTQ